MQWYELARNPKAVGELYTNVPPLQSVRIREVHLSRNGPNMRLLVDFPVFPDKIPSRWKFSGYNAVQLQLDVSGVDSVQISHWSAENLVDIHIEKTLDNQIRLDAQSAQCRIQTIAWGFRITVHKFILPAEKGVPD